MARTPIKECVLHVEPDPIQVVLVLHSLEARSSYREQIK
jgi:hypothetical protein